MWWWQDKINSQFKSFPYMWFTLLIQLLKQGYAAPRLKSSLQKFYCYHYILVVHYKISILKWKWIFSILHRFLSDLTMSNMACLIRHRNCLPFVRSWVHPCFFFFFCEFCAANFYSFLYCVFLFCLTSFHVLCPILPVSLDCLIYSWLPFRFSLTFTYDCAIIFMFGRYSQTCLMRPSWGTFK